MIEWLYQRFIPGDHSNSQPLRANARDAEPDAPRPRPGQNPQRVAWRLFLNPQLVVCETIVLNGYEWLLMMIDGY